MDGNSFKLFCVERQPTDNFERDFVEIFTRDKEICVPFFAGDNFVDSMDKTADYVQNIIQKNGLQKLSLYEDTVCNVRWTEEIGHHYWVRVWERPH